jgi:hypothetical protein
MIASNNNDKATITWLQYVEQKFKGGHEHFQGPSVCEHLHQKCKPMNRMKKVVIEEYYHMTTMNEKCELNETYPTIAKFS